MLELRGIKYISTPRPGRRGGGAAIAVRLEKFPLSKLSIKIPRNVEAVWGLLKPKIPSSKIHAIIACSFYSPPNSRSNQALIDHVTTTIHSLINIHANAGIILSGDRNDMSIDSFLSVDPTLSQALKIPTRGANTLDIIASNLRSVYNEPELIPPITPDNPNKGVPSDHSGLIMIPSTSQCLPPKRTKNYRFIRPISESLIPKFKTHLIENPLTFLPNEPVSEMIDKLQYTFNDALKSVFPEKRILCSPDDVPWFTEEFRLMRRQRQRRYARHGKEQQYLQMK